MWRRATPCLLQSFPAWTAIGQRAGNPTSRLSNQVRGFVRKRLSESRYRDLTPVDDVEGSSGSVRNLLKPFLFATTVTGATFTAAAIWQYETFRSLAKQQQQIPAGKPGGNSRIGGSFYGKAWDFRNRLNAWWNRLYPVEKLVCGIIGANVAVFVAWRIPRLTALMTKYFMASPMAGARCWPMILSTFSHYGLVHLFINMYVLWSFAPVASSRFGKEQFMATYVTAGVVSSFASYVYKVVRASSIPSVGASGAIMALIGIVGACYPDTRLSIAFVSQVFPHSFSADSGVKSLIVLDTLGVLFGWRYLDHAGHLGGMLFGIWFAKYGHELARRHRDAVVQIWHRLRTKP